MTADLANHIGPLGASWRKSQNCTIPFCTIANKNEKQNCKKLTQKKHKQTKKITTENVVSVLILVQLHSATPSVQAAAQPFDLTSCGYVHTHVGIAPEKLWQCQIHLQW